MKTALLATLLALAALPTWGQPVGKETIVYRLTDGFPPYQIEAQEVDAKGRYKAFYEVNRVDWDAYSLCEWKTPQFMECSTIRHVKNGRYGESIDGKVQPIDTSWYFWDEKGCLVHYALDPLGRGMWFRYCQD
jgi:hypothetical protein